MLCNLALLPSLCWAVGDDQCLSFVTPVGLLREQEIDDSVDRIVAGMEGTPMVDGKSKSLVAYHEVPICSRDTCCPVQGCLVTVSSVVFRCRRNVMQRSGPHIHGVRDALSEQLPVMRWTGAISVMRWTGAVPQQKPTQDDALTTA